MGGVSPKLAAFVVAASFAVLSACSRDREPELLNLEATNTTPDEFAVLPTKPLELPETFAELPTPTPGGRNRTDPTPEADAYIALGGNPAAIAGPARDGALITRASRYGVSPAIRSELAAADLEFRRRNDGRLLERLFDVNVYYNAYESQELDQHRELLRFRRAGAWTPSAPPEAGAE